MSTACRSFRRDCDVAAVQKQSRLTGLKVTANSRQVNDRIALVQRSYAPKKTTASAGGSDALGDDGVEALLLKPSATTTLQVNSVVARQSFGL
jgi:hypothetical protein